MKIMTQVSWQIRAIKRLVPGTDIKADECLVESTLKTLIANNTIYSYIVDYFKGESRIEEIASKYNIDAKMFVCIVRNILSKLKQNGFLKYIASNGDDIKRLIDQVSYNANRFHISYLPIPIKSVESIDRVYRYTMISDLVDMYYENRIKLMYRRVIRDALVQFGLIDIEDNNEKDEYPSNVYRRLYFIDKNETIDRIPENFEENIKYVLDNIGSHGDEFELIIMKYKECKSYREISIEMKCDEKDVQYAIESIFRVLGEPRISKALALGVKPRIKDKKEKAEQLELLPITESSPITRLRGTLRSVLITRLEENGIKTISDLKPLSRMSLLSMNGVGDINADEIIRVAKMHGIEIPRYRKDAPIFKNNKAPGNRKVNKTSRDKKNAEGGCLYFTPDQLFEDDVKANDNIWPINFISRVNKDISKDDVNIDGIYFVLDQLTTKYGKETILAVYKDLKKLKEVRRTTPGYEPRGIIEIVVKEISSNPVLMKLLTTSIEQAKDEIRVNPNYFIPENILMWGLKLYTINSRIYPQQIYSITAFLNIVGWTFEDLDNLDYDKIREANKILIKNHCMFINFTKPKDGYKISDDASVCDKILYILGLYHLPGSSDVSWLELDICLSGKSRSRGINMINILNSNLSTEYVLKHYPDIKDTLANVFDKKSEFIIYGLKEFNDRFYKSLVCIGFEEGKEKNVLVTLLNAGCNRVGDIYNMPSYIMHNTLSADEICTLNNVLKRIGLFIPPK